MNYIQEQFEKRTGLNHDDPAAKWGLTIFRKGVEAGYAFRAKEEREKLNQGDQNDTR